MIDLDKRFLAACRYATDTPALLSMLYDIGLMPEQARTEADQRRLVIIVAHWNASFAYAEQRLELLRRVRSDWKKWAVVGDATLALIEAGLDKNPNPSGHPSSEASAAQAGPAKAAVITEASGPVGLGPTDAPSNEQQTDDIGALRRALMDPLTVHVNMLRCNIAAITMRQCAHVWGEKMVEWLNKVEDLCPPPFGKDVPLMGQSTDYAEWLTRKVAEQGDLPEPSAEGGPNSPSCLCCGQQRPAKVWLTDHPEVYVCDQCYFRAHSAPFANDPLTGNRTET